MQDDRRPNVGGTEGSPTPAPTPADGARSGKDLERQARLLRKRRGADGHIPEDRAGKGKKE